MCNFAFVCWIQQSPVLPPFVFPPLSFPLSLSTAGRQWHRHARPAQRPARSVTSTAVVSQPGISHCGLPAPLNLLNPPPPLSPLLLPPRLSPVRDVLAPQHCSVSSVRSFVFVLSRPWKAQKSKGKKKRSRKRSRRRPLLIDESENFWRHSPCVRTATPAVNRRAAAEAGGSVQTAAMTPQNLRAKPGRKRTTCQAAVARCVKKPHMVFPFCCVCIASPPFSDCFCRYCWWHSVCV